MQRLVKKYFVELVLTSILFICIITLTVINGNESKEEKPTNMEDLFTYENPEGDSFYSKMERMKEADYYRKQVVSIGDKVRIATYMNFINYDREDLPSFMVSVDTAMIADTFCGAKVDGRKYLVLYMTVENLYDREAVMCLFPQNVIYYNKQTGEKEYRKIQNDSELYNSYTDRNLAFSKADGAMTVKFEEFYYSSQLIYVPAEDVTRVKMIYPIDSADEQLFNSNYELLVENKLSNKDFYNSEYWIKIPFDKVKQINNVNDGWDNEQEEKEGNLYDKKKRLTTTFFDDFQIKHAGETANCYMDGSKVNIILESSTLSDSYNGQKQENIKYLKLNLIVENEGITTAKWNEKTDFNVIPCRINRFVCINENLMVADWKKSVIGNDVVIEAGEIKKLELIIPVNYDVIPDYMKEDFILVFQRISENCLTTYTNEDFAFILDWDKVVIEND